MYLVSGLRLFVRPDSRFGCLCLWFPHNKKRLVSQFRRDLARYRIAKLTESRESWSNGTDVVEEMKPDRRN